ncbi:MAG: hypothetical protein KAR40_09695 [Candidatus Sabulitectum sp.]|nr:hypothetical protein [Candidatus Sabulitectum sp.]
MIHTRAIEIITLLKEPFDYKEYVAKCEELDFPILPEGSYVQKAGIAKAGMVKYPHLEPKRAYLMQMADISKASTTIVPPKAEGEGCCGKNETEGADIK